MNEKIAIQELAEQLAESKGIKPTEAETLIKEFFKVIEKALQTDRYVKIKGLGTFKLIEVDSRESININTGERIEIQGHNKITFTPDTALKELVNKPFAHFESVMLNDGALIDDLPTDEDDSEDPIPTIEEAPSRDATHCVREDITEEPIVEENNTPTPLLPEGEVPLVGGVVGKETESDPTIEEAPSRDVACSVREDEEENEEPITEAPTIEEAPSRDATHCVREDINEEPIIEEINTPTPLLPEGEVSPVGGVVGEETEADPTIEEAPGRDATHCVREDITEEPIVEENNTPTPLLPEGGVPLVGGVVGKETEADPTIEEDPSRDVACSVREDEEENEEPITEAPTIEEDPSRDVACSVREDITEEESPQPTPFISESITHIESDLENNKRPESMIGNLKNTIANDFKQDTQGMKYFFGIVAFIILLCVAAITFLYHPTLLTDLMPQPQEQEEVTTEEITPQETIPADTVAIPADTVVVNTDTIAAQPEPVVEEKPQPTPQPAPQPATTYKASEVYTITGTQAEHTIKRGETLRIVSEKYFGTRELSTYIVEHNKDIISNPNNVAVGTKIKIPKLEKK